MLALCEERIGESNMVWTEDDVRMGDDEGMGRCRGWKERVGGWILAALLGMGVLALGAGIGWYQMFYMPYCVRVDLRGREIDVEIMRRWEEREKDGTMGIIRMAGWRMETLSCGTFLDKHFPMTQTATDNCLSSFLSHSSV